MNKTPNILLRRLKNAMRIAAVVGAICAPVATAQAADEINSSYRLTSTSIMAMDTDYAAKYDLKVNKIKSSTGIEANEALLTGAVDVAEVGITPFVTLLSRTSDVVAIGVVSSGGGMYRTVVKNASPYQSMDDLKGKKIAIKLGSGNYSAFLIYIASRGWKESDFQLVNTGDQEAIAALTAGSVDAVIYWEPIVSILISKGIARPIFSFKGIVENPVFLVTNRATIAKKPAALQKYVATFMDGQSALSKDVAGSAAMITSALNKAGQQIDGKAIELSIPSMAYDIALTDTAKSEAKENWALLQKAGKLRGNEPDWSSAFDSQFIEAAQKLRK
ncbi:ABC transporter substrate-binding protein [Agrobacterium vitis]|uniref:ABC transporter substrate-binding protein n=1 Tax=Agrobacterium vitis TaxID=373 RepID=UPI001574EC28|nr:ABC transporter substrate-binding protein [Agrobacterium vitis]NSZ20053.1 ABC transporter substrate-binding protein [Agrobacterium vitis]QZO07494.1 ABC transporter substrate-binding protein [Agrobacterium vitis]UJL90688.1 ABC transporter substrate-binding protein [Agrobacterium vitis]